MLKRFLVAALILTVLVGGALLWQKGVRSAARDDAVFERGLSEIAFGSTRGHFTGGVLLEGHQATSYEQQGSLPGLGAPSAMDIFVAVHGLNNSQMKAENRFALARESLQKNGYEGVVVGWSWDGSTNWDPFGATGYREAKKNAIGNGPKLAAFLRDLAKANPGASLRVIGYSMGARVVLEALKSLDCTPPATRVLTSAHLVGAAIDNEEVQTDERYGSAIERQAGVFFNYFSPQDDKLGSFFPLRDADRALGQTDIEHKDKSPFNYRSHDVRKELKAVDKQGRVDPTGDLGKNHSGYLGIRDDAGVWCDDGVMDVVVEDIKGL